MTERGRVAAAAVVVRPCGPQAAPCTTTVRIVLAREALVRPR
ncbi:hypothetical protein [Nocardioides litoris]|nr:hypothetical protein [Nocardioides litoris]